MKLSSRQIAAAKARGFVLFPASQSQIDRMTMQRRIFDVEGRPHVVSRDGVYFETHATLAPVIGDAAAEPELAPEPQAQALPAPEPEAEPAPDAEAEPEMPAPRAPRRRTPRARAETAAAPEQDEAPASTGQTLTLPGLDALAEPVGEEPRRRRARAVEAPRWQIAGAIRRGRQPRA